MRGSLSPRISAGVFALDRLFGDSLARLAHLRGGHSWRRGGDRDGAKHPCDALASEVCRDAVVTGRVASANRHVSVVVVDGVRERLERVVGFFENLARLIGDARVVGRELVFQRADLFVEFLPKVRDSARRMSSGSIGSPSKSSMFARIVPSFVCCRLQSGHNAVVVDCDGACHFFRGWCRIGGVNRSLHRRIGAIRCAFGQKRGVERRNRPVADP